MARLTESDYEAMAGFRYALRRFLRFSKELLAQYRLTPEQYEALLALRAFAGRDGLLVRELSERLQVKHHSAVALTDRLAAASLVTKKRGLHDRRHVYVKLTAAGLQLIERAVHPHRREIGERSVEMIALLKKLQK